MLVKKSSPVKSEVRDASILRRVFFRNASLPRGDQPRSGRGGDENLIAVTLSYPLYYRRDQRMTGADRLHGRLPL